MGKLRICSSAMSARASICGRRGARSTGRRSRTRPPVTLYVTALGRAARPEVVEEREGVVGLPRLAHAEIAVLKQYRSATMCRLSISASSSSARSHRPHRSHAEMAAL